MEELGLLTPAQVAKALDYHINHVYRLLAQDRIEGKRLGRSWGIPKEEVDRIKQLRNERGHYWH